MLISEHKVDEEPVRQSMHEAAVATQTAEGGQVVSIPRAKADNVIFNSYDAEVVKGRKAPSSAWLHAPALLELLKTADDRLTRVSESRGATVRRVTMVRAAKVKGKRVVYIIPTSDEDPDGIPVSRYRSGAWINLITLLGPEKQAVPMGYRDRHAVEFAPEGSPVGPALVINLARPLDRRTDKKGRPASLTQQEQLP